MFSRITTMARFPATSPVLVLTLFLVLAPLVAEASQSLGRVASLSGAVWLNDKPPHAGQMIMLGDILKTGVDGNLQLRFHDGSTLDIFPDSAVQVDENLSQGLGDDTSPPFSLSQLFGVMQAFIASMVGDELVVTPAMSLGIRGTRFLVTVNEDGESFVSVQQGVLAASPLNVLEAGPQTFVNAAEQAGVSRPGAALRLEQARITTPEQALALRQKLLKALLPRLPLAAERMHTILQRLLPRLERLHGQILEETQRLQESANQKRSVIKRPGRLRAAKQLRKTRRLRSMLRRFSIGVLRGKGIFLRAARLQQLMPRYIQETHPSQTQAAAVTEKLEQILQQREQTLQRIKEMVSEIKASVAMVKDTYRP